MLRSTVTRTKYRKKLDDLVDPIICYVRDQEDPDTQWKIALPYQMVKPKIEWFHDVMGHPGQKRLNETLRQRYYNRKLRYWVDRFKCKACQEHKLPGRGYGLLPQRELRIVPWEEVAVDLIGPWPMKVNGRELEFSALTCIDTVTNLVELIRVDNKTAQHVSDKFCQSWLTRYPRPMRVLHDKGGEFKGREFSWLLKRFGIQDVPSTSKNPQSNSICERMHQTVGNILRILIHTNPPLNITQAKETVDMALAQATHAMRTAVMTTLGSPPGSLAFSRDMFLNIPLIADWQAIAKHREQRVNYDLLSANRKRRWHDYAPGQKVLKTVHNPTKLGVRTTGPYTIERCHVNVNLTIKLRDRVTKRLNIRRVKSYD